MAYEIPSDFVLPPGRLLVQADEGADNPCIGTIIRFGEEVNWGCFRDVFRFPVQDYTKLRRTIDDPNYVPPEPEEPTVPPEQIHIDYTKIVFNRKTAQEVKLGNEDYFLIHITDIFGLIPPE